MRAQKLTAKEKKIFLEHLALTGNVSAASRLAGVARPTPYKRRNSDPEFAAAWEEALDEAADALEAEARRRAVDGCEESVFYQGKECGTVRKYSDALLKLLLMASRPEKFAERQKHEHSGVVAVNIEDRLRAAKEKAHGREDN